MNNDLKVLLSALKPSQYRKYWKQWKGKAPYEDNGAIEENKFILNYVNENVDARSDFDEEKFKKNFKKVFIDSPLGREIFEQRLDTFHKSDILSIDYAFLSKDIKDKYNNNYAEFRISEYADTLWYKYKQKIFSGETDFTDTEFYGYTLKIGKDEHNKDLIKELYDEGQKKYKEYLDNRQLPTRDFSKVYKELFGGEYRVYLPIEISTDDILNAANKNSNGIRSSDIEKINKLRINAHYIIYAYFNMLGKNEYIDILNHNYSKDSRKIQNDFIMGKVNIPGTKNYISTGKVLNTIKKKNPKWLLSDVNDTSIDEIIQMYNTRLTTFSGKVVISRHPYDIAGMSTDRGWTSCMKLPYKDTPGGEYHQYIETSIMNGVLIAYLVKDGDENINNPTSRLLIKPYIKSGKKININNPNWILLTSDQYGTVYKSFMEVVNNWVHDNWNKSIFKKFKDKEFEFDKNNFYLEQHDKTYY